MNIAWNNLRPFHNSLNSAFEELCCQLAACEKVPFGSTFKRKGVPDAGVECFWKLPDSTEKAWQAKFFSELGDSQWKQLDKSVETALEKHPNLVTYTICLPFDLRDPRIKGRDDLMDKWEAHVKKWREWAAAKGLPVEFPYWGEHEIWERLSREEHHGRFFFWFNKDFFSQKWLTDLVDIAIANAGPRYTPEHHVGLPIAKIFEGLGRTKAFYDQIRLLRGKLRKVHQSLRLDDPYPTAIQLFTDLNDGLLKLFALLEMLPESKVTIIDFQAVTSLCERVSSKIWEADRLLDEAKKTRNTPEGQERPKDQPHYHDPGNLKHYLWELISQIRAVETLAESDGAQLTNTPALLLLGDAGTGKSHLFCDVARQRIESNLPTVLLLGENFSTDEPWSQIMRMLGLNCSRDDFLGALEAAAQAADARALIMIDALNEGDGKQLWYRSIAGMLKTLEKYPWIGLAVSVRSSYKSTIIPEGLVPDKIIQVEHVGFAGHELEATTTFFNHYKIKTPSVPLLSPEFHNPLFLKLFCKGLANKGLTEVPTGLQGITAIFDFFIESANEKLWKLLDYDLIHNPVKKAVNKLVDLMADKGEALVLRDEAKAAIESVLPSAGWERSLFRHLISEGIIAEDRKLTSWENREWIDIVRFSYERLSDHLITKRLLDRHLDDKNPSVSFLTDQPLGALVKDEHSCWVNRGIVEALCIQLPERAGKELFDCAPECSKWQPALEAFIDSLVWRSPKAFGETFRDYFNQAARQSEEMFRQLLNGLLTVATNPDHVLNADFLDQRLKKDSLPQRDSWWSIFLHYDYSDYDNSAVRRLIDWAWSSSDKSHIGDESLRLCGVALGWFLTTSNRFLRDRTTKALVALFTPRISTFRTVLRQFQGVNDLYLMERLYAVAYGCSMRSRDKEGIGALATDVYEQVFKDGSPPAHILLRDYARGVIEMALHRSSDLPIEVGRIRPPYGSDWPQNIPAEDEVEILAKKLSDGKESQSHIYDSVMTWGDFERYVIGTNSSHFDWTSRRLSEAAQPTSKEIYNGFRNSLTERQDKELQKYQNIHANLRYFLRLDDSKRREEFGEGITEKLFKSVMVQQEHRLKKTLGKKKGELFEKHVIPYINNPNQHDEHRFDLSIAQRFVLKRVVELGWQRKLFGKFDDNVNRWTNDYRTAHKAERIGKKYQWIAWHEFLARVADNFEYNSDEWSGRKEVYEGPWQDSSRDIDPSSLLKKTERQAWKEFSITWWFPIKQGDWGSDWVEQQPDEDWINRPESLPDFKSLIEVVNPKDDSMWLSLDAYYKWDQPIPVGEDEERGWRKQIWLHLHSYLVRKEDSDEVFEWAQQQDFFGDWMPKSHELYKVFLGEFFWSPAYKYFNVPYYHHAGWTRGDHDRVPKPVYVSTEEYLCESQGFDCSIDDGHLIKMPCNLIVNEMSLDWCGIEGEFYDKDGKLIALDPSVRNVGPGTLLIRKKGFLKFLEANGYSMLWIMLGEKMNWHRGGHRDKWLGRLRINGAYRTEDNGLIGSYFTKPDDR